MPFNSDNTNEHAEAATQYDPWASSATAEIQSRPIYGELDIEAYAATFEKGRGKVRLAPDEVAQLERWKIHTIVDMRVFPLTEMRNARPVERNLCAEGDYDSETRRTIYTWIKLVRPSLAECLGHALGQADMRVLSGKWVKVEYVPDGRKYRDKEGNERDSTTIKFLAVYADEAACRAAYFADSGREMSDEDGTEAIPGFESAPPPAAEPPKANGITRETARQFLGALVKDGGSNMSKLTVKLQMMPMITAHFPIGSDALQQAISEIVSA